MGGQRVPQWPKPARLVAGLPAGRLTPVPPLLLAQKPTVIVTGASSGLGLNAANSLAQSGDWHVIMACRDFAKAERAAQKLGMPKGSYTVMHLDLASLESVRQFVQNFKNRCGGAEGGTHATLGVLLACVLLALPY